VYCFDPEHKGIAFLRMLENTHGTTQCHLPKDSNPMTQCHIQQHSKLVTQCHIPQHSNPMAQCHIPQYSNPMAQCHIPQHSNPKTQCHIPQCSNPREKRSWNIKSRLCRGVLLKMWRSWLAFKTLPVRILVGTSNAVNETVRESHLSVQLMLRYELLCHTFLMHHFLSVSAVTHTVLRYIH
jgi:hypothetical protein